MGMPSFAIFLMLISMLVVSILVGGFVGRLRNDSTEAKLSITKSQQIIEKNKWFDNESKWKKVQEGGKLTYEEFYEPKMVNAIHSAPVVAKLCNESIDTCATITDKHYYYLNPYKGEHFVKPKLPPFTAQDIYGFYTQERTRRVKVAVDKCNAGLLDQCEVLLMTSL